jgi:GTPase Era involved in 16S rRNA processing
MRTPVILTINRKNQFNLTLVDLPGLYYGNNEMTNVIKQIYGEYIKNPNCIILYTTSVTNDWDISEALAIARDHDPDQQRTLTVLTKIDRREGTNFLATYQKMTHGNLGTVVVRNRNPEELKQKVAWE